MQQTILNPDSALSARLSAYRQLLLRADAQDAPMQAVRMPDGTVQTISTQADGLPAAGVLLAYALLGRFDADVQALMQQAEQQLTDRQLRRLCGFSLQMMQQDAASFQLQQLLSCLRMAIATLPESTEPHGLPGLQTGIAAPAAKATLNARFAWADDAAIAYITLPASCTEAVIGGRTYTAEACRMGICLAPGETQLEVRMGDTLAVLHVEDPLKDVHFSVCLLLSGRWRVPISQVPKRFCRHFPAQLCISGPSGTAVPALRLVTSGGEAEHAAFTLGERPHHLRCPALDPQQDTCVKCYGAGIRYIDLNREA